MGQTLCRPLVRHRRGQRGWLSTGTAPFFLSLTQGGRYRAVTPKVFPAVMPTDSSFSASDTSAKNGSMPRAPAASFDNAAVMMSIKRLDTFRTLHGFDENAAAAAAAASATSGSPNGSGTYEDAGEQMVAPVLSFRDPSRPSTAVLAGAAVPACLPSAGFAYSGNRFNGSIPRKPPGSLSSDKPSAAFLSNALASRWSSLKSEKAAATAAKRQDNQGGLLLAVRPLRRAD